MTALSPPTRSETVDALRRARLYAILDTGYAPPETWKDLATGLIKGGVGVVQIRAKGEDPAFFESIVPEIRSICRTAGVPLILNDHPELAAKLNVDGCHLGQDDLALAEAGKVLKPYQICGKSTHSREQVAAAETEGADYIGFGPLFPTPTKPEYPAIGLENIQWVNQNISIPSFCIGGVNLETIGQVVESGARRVVVVSALLLSTHPQQTAEKLLTALSPQE